MTSTPDLSQPLVREPAQADPPANSDLGPFQHLVGTWTNQNLSGTQAGGPTNPYSFNFMVLPEGISESPGVILKNFKYYEEVTFSAIHGTAPNRGGDLTQTCNTLFYEQRVFFSEDPDKDKLVHAENGSWLYLKLGPQHRGPYGTGGTVHGYDGHHQDPNANIVKQISVPHGNSILAVGDWSQVQEGAVTIPNYPEIGYPNHFVKNVYDHQTDNAGGNPDIHFWKNPSAPLQRAAAARPAHRYIKWQVGMDQTKGGIVNVGFETSKARVTSYKATYWLQDVGQGTRENPVYTQLFYIQEMGVELHRYAGFSFPHVTCNALTRAS